MAGCPVCGAQGPGDPAVGISEDAGVCPRCEEQGYEDAGRNACGCYYTPASELRECSAHEGNAAEAAYERSLENFYGGSAPVTIQEQYVAAWEQKRALKR